MKKSALGDDFVRHVVDSLRDLGPVDVKRMFGGWGLYHQGVFFALVMGGTLYLKTDERNRPHFDRKGLAAFTFEKGGETIVTAYRAAPGEALEDRAVMARWARGAYEAALRKGAKRPARHS
ncbi:MAG TPA: TfoX/Sxy family protein [Usitatibacter sp.]|nr:TfoX/Sxy family protein [Usitatibacter sp.]